MAGSPEWKIYDAQNVYQAACKEIEAAAALVAFYGAGAQIRLGHSLRVWVEGNEERSAGESYDGVAETVAGRVERVRRQERSRKYVGPRSRCVCGHGGDGLGRSAAGDEARHAGPIGHGACTAEDCDCQKFTWKAWLPAFEAAISSASP